MNIVINCAANNEIDQRLDIALKVNVDGPMNLLHLASEFQNLHSFVHLSTTFAMSDRTGYLEERLYESPVSWNQAYSKINTMSIKDLVAQER